MASPQEFIMRVVSRLLVGTLSFVLAGTAYANEEHAQDRDDRLDAIQSELDVLSARDAESDRKRAQLKRELDVLRRGESHDQHVEHSEYDREADAGEHPAEHATSDDLWSSANRGTRLRLMDLAADLLFAVGSSTERDSSLETLQGSDHDPRNRGFTLQALELSVGGAVDPYFTMEAYVVLFFDQHGETVFELEEAFMTTMSLPFGLDDAGVEVELGQFFTEFGIQNPQHVHEWHWLDQPVVLSRFFGADGLRAPGVRIGWETPLPWFSKLHVGAQNAGGETVVSFLANDDVFTDRPIGGGPFVEQDLRTLDDLLYLARWDNGWDVSDELSSKFGMSFLTGPNSTGPDGCTLLYGFDFVLTWRPADHDEDSPFVIWQTEAMKRDYHTDDALDGGANPVESTILRDWGLYTQLLYGFTPDWALGCRFEYASGKEHRIGPYVDRDADPYRDTRFRVSPLVVWQPSESCRVRFQYNYDDADHLRHGYAHSVWLGFEASIGSHTAHRH
jgi:hypothetical protein